jgi:hypothetical protein
MRTILFIVGTFFLSITYGQSNYFFTTISESNDQKIKQGRFAALFINPAVNTNIVDCWAFVSSKEISSYLNKIWLEKRMKSIDDNWFFNYKHTVTIKNTNLNNILKTDPADRWQIEPITQTRLKELRDFLEGAETNYICYFD